MGKKLVLNAAGDAATVTAATIGDAVTTIASPDTAVTGMEKFLQLGGMFLAGMSFKNYQNGNGLNPLA